MTTGQESRSFEEVLLCRPDMMSPEESTGLWWCLDPEDVPVMALNAVCKSRIATWADVEHYADFIKQFPYVFIPVPPCQEREELATEITTRFGMPVLLPEEKAFKGKRNLREYIDAYGWSKSFELIFGAKMAQVQGLLNIADVDTDALKNVRRTMSGIKALDDMIGGFSGGELSIWTGKRGEGKSTLLSQVLLDAVNQSHKVCVYSGEMPAPRFKLSMMEQAAGYRFLRREEIQGTGKEMFVVDKTAAMRINEWWDKCLFLTDIRKDNAHDEDNILALFEYARRVYGCDTFLVDNIMTARLKHEAQLGMWQAQSEFAGRLVSFSKANGVHVHLVAHPRKTGKASIETDDVGGSGDITNRADNVLKVERVPEEHLEKVGCSTVLTVMKNREFGSIGAIKLNFNRCGRRFYQAGGDDRKKYSWELLT